MSTYKGGRALKTHQRIKALKPCNTLIVPVTNGPESALTIGIMKWHLAVLFCSLACFLGQVAGDFVIVQVGSSRTLTACPLPSSLDADCKCFSEGTGAQVSGIDVGDAYSTSHFAIREGLCGKGRLECRETNSGGISYLIWTAERDKSPRGGGGHHHEEEEATNHEEEAYW